MSGLLAQNAQNLKVNFKIKNIGTYAKGTFSDSSLEGVFDEKDLNKSHLRAVIKIQSINTGIDKRDKHLLEADYFDAKNHPNIIFETKQIEKIAEDQFSVKGEINIKGQKRTLSIVLRSSEVEGIKLLSSDFELRRKDFGVGGKSWILSDKVKAQIQFTVRKI